VNHKKEKCQESSFSLDIIVKKKLPALSKKQFKEPKKKKKKPSIKLVSQLIAQC
jgi:hypothetical protein